MHDSFPSLQLASLTLPLTALAGVTLDRLFGEARRWHPLVGFGRLANAIEYILNRANENAQMNSPSNSPFTNRLRGLLAWALIVFPFVVLSFLLCAAPYIPSMLAWALNAVLLYFALGGRSLAEHATRVANDLAAGDLPAARQHVGWMVSRDTDALDASNVAKACIESTLENGNDAIFAALFWFALLGGPGAVLFRLANTLDAMWGYKNARFLHFGWAAARIDDILNYLPARLTALSYALCGSTRTALRCWRNQAPAWQSPNAGPVMAAGAGSLGLALGGEAIYEQKREERPPLGEGRMANGADIARALTLVRRSVLLWLIAFFLVAAFFSWGISHA